MNPMPYLTSHAYPLTPCPSIPPCINILEWPWNYYQLDPGITMGHFFSYFAIKMAIHLNRQLLCRVTILYLWSIMKKISHNYCQITIIPPLILLTIFIIASWSCIPDIFNAAMSISEFVFSKCTLSISVPSELCYPLFQVHSVNLFSKCTLLSSFPSLLC